MPRTFSVVKTSYTRSASEAKASVRYMQHRQSDLGESGHRQLFGRGGELSRAEVYECLDQAAEAQGKTYFYRLVFNPGEGHADLSEEERQAWAAEVMARIEAQGNQVREWVGVSHIDQGEHDHLHILAATSRTLQKDELADLRTYSREAYDHQREVQHQLGLYLDHPGGTQELARAHQHERSLADDQQQQRRQQSLDFDYGGGPMKHPDGTPFTPTEQNAERIRRWTWLSKEQRSAHPISSDSLPLFKRYADGELSLEEVREGLRRLYDRRRFPEGPDGPEVPEPPPLPATGEPVVYGGVMVMAPDPPRPSREAQEEAGQRLIEHSRQEHPDDPLIGKWVSFTASAFPEEEEGERGLN